MTSTWSPGWKAWGDISSSLVKCRAAPVAGGSNHKAILLRSGTFSSQRPLLALPPPLYGVYRPGTPKLASPTLPHASFYLSLSVLRSLISFTPTSLTAENFTPFLFVFANRISFAVLYVIHFMAEWQL
jgi:hypothetical protein